MLNNGDVNNKKGTKVAPMYHFSTMQLLRLSVLVGMVFYITSIFCTSMLLETTDHYMQKVLGQEKGEDLSLQKQTSCVRYDPESRVVTITCEHATLADIDDRLKDPDTT